MHGEPFHKLTIMSDESDEEVDDIHGLIEVICGGSSAFKGRKDKEPLDDGPEKLNGEEEKIVGLLRDAQNKIYPGCEKFMTLSFIVKLVHIKCINDWRNKLFWMLL